MAKCPEIVLNILQPTTSYNLIIIVLRFQPLGTVNKLKYTVCFISIYDASRLSLVQNCYFFYHVMKHLNIL